VPSQPSYLPNIVAHLASLGLSEGKAIPSYREIAEVIGIHRDSAKRLLRELRVAGVLHEGAAPGAPAILHRPEILAALATPEGMAQYREGRRAVAEATPRDPAKSAAAEAVAGGGNNETLALLLGRLDRVAIGLEGSEEASRELLAEIRALPERIAAAVASALGGAAVREGSQTPRAEDPNTANTARLLGLLAERLGYQATATRLMVHKDTVGRIIRGARGASPSLTSKIKALCGELEIG
jgi:DNA-binding Lrp family transcriptional regulator